MSTTFATLGVRADIVTCLSNLGITEPYPIQAATLVDGLSGADLIAQSPTGSGKTLAFAIPVVTRVGKATRGAPRALVLAPTRELAAQIAAEIHPLAKTTGRRVASFYGGTGFGPQLSALRGGVDIAVGCPGRLIDLLERRAISLTDIEIVVIDEVDRMADMGFMPDVRRLLGAIQGSHQTMFFSATLSRDVERLVRDHQRSPKRHVVQGSAHDVSSHSHELWKAGHEDRVALVTRLVGPYGSSIIFCRTKHGVDRLTRRLAQSGVSAVPLHGGRSQAQRDRALAQFRDRKAQVLVGTDVAARGLHIDGVDCVVHFDPPEDEDTYVHRSGRTGRAGASGLVISIVTPDQEKSTRRMHERLGLKTHARSASESAAHVADGQRSAAEYAKRRPPQNNDETRSRPERGNEKSSFSAPANRRNRSRRRTTSASHEFTPNAKRRPAARSHDRKDRAR